MTLGGNDDGGRDGDWIGSGGRWRIPRCMKKSLAAGMLPKKERSDCHAHVPVHGAGEGGAKTGLGRWRRRREKGWSHCGGGGGEVKAGAIVVAEAASQRLEPSAASRGFKAAVQCIPRPSSAARQSSTSTPRNDALELPRPPFGHAAQPSLFTESLDGVRTRVSGESTGMATQVHQ